VHRAKNRWVFEGRPRLLRRNKGRRPKEVAHRFRCGIGCDRFANWQVQGSRRGLQLVTQRRTPDKPTDGREPAQRALLWVQSAGPGCWLLPSCLLLLLLLAESDPGPLPRAASGFLLLGPRALFLPAACSGNSPLNVWSTVLPAADTGQGAVSSKRRLKLSFSRPLPLKLLAKRPGALGSCCRGLWPQRQVRRICHGSFPPCATAAAGGPLLLGLPCLG